MPFIFRDPVSFAQRISQFAGASTRSLADFDGPGPIADSAMWSRRRLQGRPTLSAPVSRFYPACATVSDCTVVHDALKMSSRKAAADHLVLCVLESVPTNTQFKLEAAPPFPHEPSACRLSSNAGSVKALHIPLCKRLMHSLHRVLTYRIPAAGATGETGETGVY